MCGRHHKPSCPNPSSQGPPRPASSAFPSPPHCSHGPRQPSSCSGQKPGSHLLLLYLLDPPPVGQRTATSSTPRIQPGPHPFSPPLLQPPRSDTASSSLRTLLEPPSRSPASTQAPHSLHSVRQPRDPVPMYLRLCHTSTRWSLSPHTHTHPVPLPPSAPATLPTWLADTAAGTQSKPRLALLVGPGPHLTLPCLGLVFPMADELWALGLGRSPRRTPNKALCDTASPQEFSQENLSNVIY